MERRSSVIRRNEHFVWHARKTLSPHIQTGISISSEEARGLQQQKQKDAETTIFNIMSSFPLKKVKRLEAMHETGEK